MVEAVNKVVKYRYLFPKDLPDGASLFKAVEDAISDYNDIRPHGSLDGLTPSEAYDSIDKESLRTSEKRKQAQTARIQANRVARCGSCLMPIGIGRIGFVDSIRFDDRNRFCFFRID